MRSKSIHTPWPAVLAAAVTILTVTPTQADPGGIQALTLSSEQPLEIGIGTRSATTLQFPEPINTLVGYGLTEDQEPGTYQYSHPAGSRLLSLRCLMPDKALVTVLLGEDMFVLKLKPSERPAAAIRLVRGNASEEIRRAQPIEAEEIEERKLDYHTDRLLSLFRLGKNERIFRNAMPHLYEGVQSRRHLDLRFDDGTVVTVIREAHRFPDEDALILFAEAESQAAETLYYDPGSLQLQVGSRLYPVTVVDASGMIAPGSKVPIHVLVKGDPEGGRAHLSIKNDFRLVLSQYEGEAPPATEAAEILEPVGGTIAESDGLPNWTVVPDGTVIDPALFGMPPMAAGFLGYGKQDERNGTTFPRDLTQAWRGAGLASPFTNEGRGAK